jgi:hypothetical protein
MLGFISARGPRLAAGKLELRMATKNFLWALPLSLSLAFVACTDDDPEPPPTGAGNNPVTTPGGMTGGANPGGTTGGANPGGTTGGANPGGTTGGANPGGTTGGASPGGTTGGASPGGTTGGGMPGGTPGGTPGGNANLVKCDSTGTEPNTKPCGSFVSTAGVELQLGPHGGQMDPNVGMGFEVLPLDTGNDEILGISTCSAFAGIFGEDPAATERLLDITNLKLDLHTVYRPANWPSSKVPIVTWGNGTCAQPEGYGALLRYLASHGFFVVAPNNRFVGSGAAQKKAVDFAFAANDDPKSPYYQKLDTTKVIAMGHSQGGMGTAAASSDERIKAAILFNGGTEAPKPFLAISGDRDIQGGTAQAYGSSVTGSSQPKVAWLWYHMIPGTASLTGHLTLMMQPERVAPASVAWAKYILLDDAESKTYFVGSSCKLCGKAAEFEFGQKGIQ